MRHLRIFAAALAVSLLAACGGADTTDPGGTPSTPDGTWRLEGASLAGEPIRVDAGSEPTLEIDGASLRGRSHCNLYDGSITLDGGGGVAITVSSTTEMACLDAGLMEAEAAYIEALSRVEVIELAEDSLILSGQDVELAYRFVPPVADVDLVGTIWVLESLITGDAVSSTVGEPATLELAADGTFQGSTGCRGFGGRFESTGGAARVGELVNDDRACMNEVARQDEHVLAVLRGGFSYTIQGASLTLMAEDGIGLGYLAEDP